MGRRINTVSYQAADGSGQKGDDFFDRIVKLIPGDVVAGWLAITSAAKAAPNLSSEKMLWTVFVGGLALAGVWTWIKSSEPKKPKPYIQMAVSTVAFLVWAYATGGAPPLWPGAIYNPLHATILIAGFTAISGLVTKA
jgi:uncharacterized membrane protein